MTTNRYVTTRFVERDEIGKACPICEFPLWSDSLVEADLDSGDVVHAKCGLSRAAAERRGERSK